MGEETQQAPAAAVFTPSEPLAAASVALLRERFADDVLDAGENRGQTCVIVRAESIARICLALRDAPDLRYNFLSDITAVDWLEREPRFDVVYQISSLESRARLTLKVRVGDDDTPEPEVPTVTGVWPAANFFEREMYDLFGIRFAGHPNMTRIMLPPDWIGHPLRKDYPLTGFALPEPHWGGQVPFATPLPPGTGQQTMRTNEGLEERAKPRTSEEQKD
jgi:NADH-quinone oxidoreductase subunit C